MKLILIKPNENAQVVELPKKHEYTDLKKLLEIDSPLTCVERKIGNKYFDIWCDDEGLLKDKKFICGVSVQSTEGFEILCGNLLIAKHDNEGNTIGLTQEEIDYILDKKKANVISVQGYRHFIGFNDTEKCYMTYGEFGEIEIAEKGEWLTYGF